MMRFPYVLGNIEKEIYAKLFTSHRVKIIGTSGTGKGTLIEKIKQKFTKEKIPVYTIGVCYRTIEKLDSFDNDPLVLSIFSNNKKVLRAYKNSKHESAFFRAAEATIKFLTSKKQSVLIIENYEKLGDYFLDRLTQVFWNLKNISILVTIEPTENRCSEDIALKDFDSIELSADFLYQIFSSHKKEIFLGTAFNEVQQDHILHLGNFDAVQYFLAQGPDAFQEESVTLENYFNSLMRKRGSRAVNLLQTSAVIGFLFEERYLIEPFQVENVANILQVLCHTGELRLRDTFHKEYEFSYDELFEYMRRSMCADKYKFLAKKLAEYFFQEAQSICNTTESDRYHAILHKSFIYYLESGETNTLCQLAFHLIDYYYSKSRYDEAIFVAEKFLRSNADCEIKLYIAYCMIDVLHDLSLHTKAQSFIQIVNDISIMCALKGYSELYKNLQQAELFYLKSAEELSLKTLNELKRSKQYTEDRYLGYRVNALLSSVLYNVVDQCSDPSAPNKYFQYAHNFGQLILDNTYYRLLQKVVLFNQSNAEVLTKKACNYFNAIGNYIELAKTKSNLGVYYLERCQYQQAKQCFEEAQSLLSSNFAKHLLATPLNNLATVYMLEGHFQKATTLLLEATKYTNDDEFTIITIAFNLSACYYKLNNIIKSELEYNHAVETIEKTANGASHFYDIFAKTHKAMELLHSRRKDQAITILQKIKTPHLFYQQLINAVTRDKNVEQFALPYLKDVLLLNVCPHYMVFE